MSGKLIHNIYFDNGVYIKLVAKGNENLFYNHYNSLICNVPSLGNSGKINIYFTWASLLEAIGLGNFRRKSKAKPKLDLTAFYIDKEDINVFQKLDQAFHYAYEYFLSLPELCMDSIICRIEEQLCHSSNKATIHFVQDTLVRYKKLIITSPKDCQKSLADYLTWDAICECPFANFEHIADQDENERKRVRQINEWLLRTFHDKKSQGIDLSIYRLADKVGNYFFRKILGENQNGKEPFHTCLKKERIYVMLM